MLRGAPGPHGMSPFLVEASACVDLLGAPCAPTGIRASRGLGVTLRPRGVGGSAGGSCPPQGPLKPHKCPWGHPSEQVPPGGG